MAALASSLSQLVGNGNARAHSALTAAWTSGNFRACLAYHSFLLCTGLRSACNNTSTHGDAWSKCPSSAKRSKPKTPVWVTDAAHCDVVNPVLNT